MLDSKSIPLGQRPHRKAYMAKWMADHKEQKRAYDKEYRIKNREKKLEYQKRMAPIQVSRRWDKFFDWPDGTHRQLVDNATSCDLCGRPFENKPQEKHTDHDKVSGEFRGFIHNGCNRAIGLLQDDEDMCLKAAAYLRRSKNARP